MISRRLALLILATAAAAVLAAGTASATDYSGDLVISSSESPRNNETITIDGSVIIGLFGSVDWTDVVLEFNSTGNPGYGLHIDGTASFVRVTIRTVPGADPYLFLVNSTASMSMEDSDVSGMAGSGSDPGSSGSPASTDFSQLRGGIQVASSQVLIGNSTIHDGDGALITVLSASPRIYGNTLHSARYLEYETSTSFSAGTQTTNYRALAACVVNLGGDPNLDTNRFERCGLDGSANATNEGSMGAWNAVSNLYLVSAGVVSLGGEPSFRLHVVTDVGQIATPTISFVAPGPVNVTHNFQLIMSWGTLLIDTGDITISGGWSSNAQVLLEVYMDAAYAGPAATLDFGPYTMNNGSYVHGVRVTATGLAVGFAVVMNQVAFAGGTGNAIMVGFSSLSAPHSFLLAQSAVGPSPTGGRGIYLEDVSSAGVPTVTVHHNTITEVGAPLTVEFQGLGAGGTVQVHNNSFTHTAGVTNTSCCSGDMTTRGAVDVRGHSFTGGTLDVRVEDNRIYNQSWMLAGSQMYPGVSVYHQGSVPGVGSMFAIVRNDISNVSHGMKIYENFGAAPLNSTYIVERNRVSISDGYGLWVYSNSQLGTVDPVFNDNIFDRPGADTSNGYGAYWQIISATPVSHDFTNITVYGNGTRTTYGLYFYFGQPSPTWTFNLRNVLVTNLTGSRGLFFLRSTVSVYNSNLTSAQLQAVTCQECTVRLVDCDVYPLSATVTTSGEVTAVQQFGAARVQWQGDGGELIQSGNLFLQWRGQYGTQTLMTIPFANARVENTSVPMWKKTVSVSDEYANLTPVYRLAGVDLTGVQVPFTRPYYGNVTILDPELPDLSYTTPAPNSQIRAHSVIVKGTVRDTTTGVAGVQISTDGVTFTNVTTDTQKGTWETTLAFAADGTYNITLHAWDRARWAITFGNYSSGYREVVIPGVVIDTLPPRIVFSSPAGDSTQNYSSISVAGQVIEENPLSNFKVTFNGAPLSTQLALGGLFSAQINNLKEGPNQISVIATDGAGNTYVASRTITVDTIPPHLVILSPTNGSSTNRAVVTIQGEVEAGVALKVNGIENVTLPYPFQLNPGANVITIEAIDTGLNHATVTRVVTLDTVPPTVQFQEPSRFPFNTRFSRVVLTATANEPLKSVTLNNISYPLTSPTTFTVEIYLDDGTHALHLTLTDMANNSAEVSPAPVVHVDTIPPSLVIDSPPDGSVVNDNNIVICGRTDSNAGLNVTNGEIRFPLTLTNPLTGEFCFEETRTADGILRYTFEATDGVGNTATVEHTVILDRVAPEVQVFDMGTTYETDNSFVQLRGKVSPGSTLTVNGTPIAVTCNPAEPSGLCDFNLIVPVGEGQSTLTLLATDAAGNEQFRTINVLRSEAAVVVPFDLGTPLILAGLAAGVVLFLLLWVRIQGQAAAENPGLGGAKAEAKRKKREERRKAQRPEPEIIYETDSQAMYHEDLRGRR